MRLRIRSDLKALFTDAAEVLAMDLSTFARVAMMEKVERMRAEGKRI